MATKVKVSAYTYINVLHWPLNGNIYIEFSQVHTPALMFCTGHQWQHKSSVHFHIYIIMVMHWPITATQSQGPSQTAVHNGKKTCVTAPHGVIQILAAVGVARSCVRATGPRRSGQGARCVAK